MALRAASAAESPANPDRLGLVPHPVPLASWSSTIAVAKDIISVDSSVCTDGK
jgi:hypothetical protein